MLDRIKQYYYGLPSPLLGILHLVPIKYRLGGRRFAETLNFLEESERWDHRKLQSYKAYALNKVLSFAVKNVPFYEGIELQGNPFEDIKKFPVISKDDIIENSSRLVRKNIEGRNVHLDTTGGTSGKQMRFYVDDSIYATEWAFMITLWKRAGYRLGDRVVSIRGGSIRFGSRLWREQPIYDALEMSPFYMNASTLPLYVTRIKEWMPRFVHGYPSALTIMAKYILDAKVRDMPWIAAALLCSENVYPFQRDLIERAFHAKTFSWYGQSEKVVLAGGCEFSQKYHIFPQYGFTELLGKDGSILEECGEEGEIVGTGFFNTAMPLIRYRTQDYATLSEEQTCRCGREYMLMENVKGWSSEREEVVIGKRGSLISLTAINIHSEEFNKIYNFQYYQERPGEVVLRIRPNLHFTKEDEGRIVGTFKKRIGDELDIVIDRVQEIEHSPTGKARLLVQKLDVSRWLMGGRSEIA